MKKANKFYASGGESIKMGLELYDTELINIHQGHSWAVSQAENNEEAARLCIGYPDWGYLILSLRQHPRERIEWLQIELTSARRLKNRGSEGAALGNLGIAYSNLGDNRQAIDLYEQRLVIAREIGDRRGEGAALGNLGLAYMNLGDYRKAIDLYEQQLVIAREIGFRLGEGNAIYNKALALDQLGQRKEAMDHAEAALRIYEQIESPTAAKVREWLDKWNAEK
jgi:tetratricopeptide (TPR) repeat protein